jgi:hypothetical protein
VQTLDEMHTKCVMPLWARLCSGGVQIRLLYLPL